MLRDAKSCHAYSGEAFLRHNNRYLSRSVWPKGCGLHKQITMRIVCQQKDVLHQCAIQVVCAVSLPAGIKHLTACNRDLLQVLGRELVMTHSSVRVAMPAEGRYEVYGRNVV